MIENRSVGIKSRELYEAPAALVLIDAHRALEDLTLTKAELRTKRGLEETWTNLVYEGHWFSPLRTAIDAFVDTTQEAVTGEVRVALRDGLRRRQRPALAERALRRDARLVRRRRDVPARGGGGLHSDRVARDRAARGARPGEGGRLTLWSGRTARPLAAGGLGLPPRRGRGAAAVRLRGDRPARAPARAGRAC